MDLPQGDTPLPGDSKKSPQIDISNKKESTMPRKTADGQKQRRIYDPTTKTMQWVNIPETKTTTKSTDKKAPVKATKTENISASDGSPVKTDDN